MIYLVDFKLVWWYHLFSVFKFLNTVEYVLNEHYLLKMDLKRF